MAFSIMARISELKEEARWCRIGGGTEAEARELERRAFALENLIKMRREVRENRVALTAE